MGLENFDRRADTAKRISDNMIAELSAGQIPGFASPSEALAIYDRIFDVAEKSAPILAWGDVLEIGAGIGIGGTLISHRDTVSTITITDFWPEYTKYVIPKCVEVFGRKEIPVFSINSDFNNMQFKDSSFDTIFAKGTLHHSRQLQETVQEIYRVLKPGGICLIVERAQDDDCPDEYLEKLLSEEVPNTYKKEFGIPKESRVTRRDLGEHELRIGEWRSVFEGVGFEVGMLSAGNLRTKQRRMLNPVFWIFAPAIAALKIARTTLRLPVESISSIVTSAYHALAIPELNFEYLMSWRHRRENRAIAESLWRELGGIKDLTLEVDSSWLFHEGKWAGTGNINLILLARKTAS